MAATFSNPGDRLDFTFESFAFTFRYCPPGVFLMGSPETEQRRTEFEKQRRVVLTKGFGVLETPVTQVFWRVVMGNDPSERRGDLLPVENVSWFDCQNFINKLNDLSVPPPGRQARIISTRRSAPVGRIATSARSGAFIAGRRLLSALFRRIPGVCSTCAETFGNGRATGSANMLTTISSTLAAQNRGNIKFFAGEVGTVRRIAFVRRFAIKIRLIIGTDISGSD